MSKTFIAPAVLALALVPVLALAQGAGVNASAAAAAPGVRATASTTLSASVMTAAKERADKEIDRRVAALNAAIARIAAMTRVTAEFKTQATTNLQNQVTALTQLRAKIDADTDGATLKDDVKTITTSYRIFALVMPQAHISAAADRAINVATMETALGAKLKSRIDAAGTAGADTTALMKTLDDLATQINTATAAAQAAVNGSLALQPDQGDKTVLASNTKALQDARTSIQSAQKALVQGRKDIESILQGLKKLTPAATASTTVQSSTQTQ